jgi:hypothetical protein
MYSASLSPPRCNLNAGGRQVADGPRVRAEGVGAERINRARALGARAVRLAALAACYHASMPKRLHHWSAQIVFISDGWQMQLLRWTSGSCWERECTDAINR